MKKETLDRSLDFIRDWLPFRYEWERYPGFAVAIAHKGKVVFDEVYGYADLEQQKKLTTDNLFRIASHSKTFTATALMQLQEQGKLRIDDYVADYLDWLKDHKDERWKWVTIRQVMSHGAGIIRDGVNAEYWQLERPFPDTEQLRKEILNAKLVLDNNVRMKYSNYGYSLLGMVVEIASGQPYNEYVKKHIIDVLGLRNTGPDENNNRMDEYVVGYTAEDKALRRLPIDSIDTRAMSSATGFYSTASDLCKYFSARMIGSGQLVNDESKKEMQRVHHYIEHATGGAMKYIGLGLDIGFLGDRKVYGHSGGFPGFVSLSRFDPENEIVVVALTNTEDGPAIEIVNGIYKLLDYYAKNEPTDKKTDFSRLEGRYKNILGTSQYVQVGDNLVAIYPHTWDPFAMPEKLRHISGTKFVPLDVSSYASVDEPIEFIMDGDRVVRVNDGGAVSVPEAEWEKRYAKMDRVTLPRQT